jgi:putative hemolysin
MDRVRRAQHDGNIFDRLLAELRVRPSVSQDELDRIPASGPLVIVANHPFGMLEGALLASLCSRVRPDVRIMVNSLMPCPGELREYFILVDPYGGPSSVAANQAPLLQAVRWLRSGGALIVFPAGDVSWPDWKRRGASDAAWSPSVARLIRMSRAAALPAYLRGSNSAGFHLLGAVHPRLRTLCLPAEFLNKRGRTVESRFGRPIGHERLAGLDDQAMIEHLRASSYLLSYRPECRRAVAPAPRQRSAPSLARAVDSLPPSSLLWENKDFSILAFQAPQAPDLMMEVGYRREEAFRAAGEGTGKPCDLDRFDRHYDQLVLWSKAHREVAGGYRMGRTESILGRHGASGLYTSTLFRFRPEFFRRLGPAVELGRSFVRPSYQKQYAPLLALWQGIGAYVCRHPECRFLFGPVSVSPDYQALSRHILALSLLSAASDPALARLVAPRRPLRAPNFPGVGEDWKRLIIRDHDELSALISELEPDGKGLPVLLRQYLRLGGRLLAFSVDGAFSGVLDGLILVDLMRADPVLLDRYFTREGAAVLRRRHGPPPAA